MTANFTPTMSSIKDMKPFRFWCQKVLPTVYDDSLSYYELLNKVVLYLNETVDNVDLLNDNVTRLYDAYVLLESYVNNFFDSNLPQMVADKLDEMAEDGTLTALIGGYVDPLFSAYEDEIDSRLSAQGAVIEAQNVIVDSVNERLDNFVVQHSGLSNETILYDGEGTPAYTAGSYLSLSDAIANYKYLRIVWIHRQEICVQDFEVIENASPAQNFNLRDTLGVPGVNPPTSKMWEMCQITLIDATSGGTNQLEIGSATVIDNLDYADGNVDNTMNTGILKVIGIKEITDIEVVDARLGYDGVTYDTLGGAIRGQIRDMENQIVSNFRNMMGVWFVTGGVSNSTGELTTNGKRWRSGYIDLEGGHYYSVESPYQLVMYEYTYNQSTQEYDYIGVLVTAYTNEYFLAEDKTVIVVLKHNDGEAHNTSADNMFRRLYKSINTGEAIDSVGCVPVLNYRRSTVNSYGNELDSTTRITTDFLPIGDNAYVEVIPNGQKFAVCLYDSSKTFLYNSGWLYQGMRVETGGAYARVTVAKYNDSDITPETSDTVVSYFAKAILKANDGYDAYTGNHETVYGKTVKTIMHRGCNSIAPENTIPAFQLARKTGFTTVECDIQLTSDGVPVVLHDATVNRTSNGTGNIYDMTFSEARELDFGSWKSAYYTGTQMPSFEEMLSLCKNIGLDIYVEIKSESPWTQERISNCIRLVKKYGMRDHVSWISFNNTVLTYVKTADPNARLGLINTAFTASDINKCLALRSGTNEVIAVTKYDQLSSDIVESLIDNDIPLCVYTVDTESAIDSMDTYASEVLTNVGNIGKYLYEKNI